MDNINPDKEYRYRSIWIGLVIFLLVLSGIANIIISIPNAPLFLQNVGNYYENLSHHEIKIYGLLHRITGFILLFISYRLYKRMEVAWTIVITTISVSIALKFIRLHQFFNPMIFAEVFILGVLIYFKDEFRRKSDNTSVKKAIFIALGSVAIMIIVSALGFFAMNDEYHELRTFYDAVIQAIKILFLMDVSNVSVSSIGEKYLDMSIIFNWIFVTGALFYILKPVVYDPIIKTKDLERVARLVERYGENPMSYMAMEDDKKYFFGKSVEGVIAFAVVNDVATVCGDMICSDEDAGIFLSEFMEFCRENHYSIMFLNTTTRFMQVYKLMGFGSVKYGEDACFLLSEYNLAGGKVAKVRAAINHVNKAGIIVSEYCPHVELDKEVEREIQDISDEWLKMKKGGELSFMMGGIGLDNPRERRFFVARDSDGRMLGFVVFVPYNNKKAYLAEVTRRRNDSPQGVMEKLIYDGFMTLKEEGVIWGSMGLVPLANVREEVENSKFTAKIFEYVYENLNQLYGFKALYHAKKKYAPTHWQSRYINYYPKSFSMNMAYAIIKVQNPKGVVNYITSFLKEIIKRI
ncbi:MAG: bifunctional lysylphosphatidylglycerol flippase/synthetase MprF [Proteocatella sp.]